MMIKNTKTSQTSRFKLVFNGEQNCWYIHDKKFGDLIQASSDKHDAQNMCSKMNAGSGFDENPIPNFLHKTS